MNGQEIEGIVKRASDKMRTDDNTKLVTKYIEHFSWLLFLKVHEAIEQEQELLDPSYKPLITGNYRWSEWTAAAAKWRADELIDFVTNDLLPHLRGLDGSKAGRLIATLFQGVTTVMKSGFGLKEVIGEVNKIDFHAPQDVHTFSVVYESLLARLGRDASWSGEFYTPRPIVKFMIDVVNPVLGERAYDPAAGSGGFLAEAYEHMRQGERTLADFERLQNGTFYGQESGELPFLLGAMNLILHGIHSPNLVRKNTLEEDVRGIVPENQYDVVLTNPPFGGRENPQIQQNFPARSSATEVLFMQHVMAYLREGGRCGVVVPDGILFRDEAAFLYVRKRLVDDFNISAIVRLPLGAFPAASDTRTNLIFFSKQPACGSIRYYQVQPPPGKKRYTKTRPITTQDLAGALRWVKEGVRDQHAWDITIDEIRAGGYDLDLMPPELVREFDPEIVDARIERLSTAAHEMAQLAEMLVRRSGDPELYRIARVERLGPYVEERGARSKDEMPTRFVGVSNAGGLVPFKGAVGSDTSRYRRVEVGDFVYNPMRVNVGSIALCRSDADTGYASPDYVVFRFRPDAPFSREYLLHYLQSSIGLRQIDREAQGTIRSRLYFENLTRIRIPIPARPDSWDKLLQKIERLKQLLLEMPVFGDGALSALIDSLYWWSPEPITAPERHELTAVDEGLAQVAR